VETPPGQRSATSWLIGPPGPPKRRNYAFDYALRAEIHSVGCPAALWRVTVREDMVAAVLCVASGLPVSGPAVTIDTLFDEALRAVRNHALSAMAFDARFGYPLRMDFAGPPDAAASVLVSQLQP
jgi:hypothetical protein